MYEFPEGLHRLRDWLRAQGMDVAAFKTERQAAFMAQRLAGTRFRFPAKGATCFPVLQQIQKALPYQAAGALDGSKKCRSPRKRGGKSGARPAPVSAPGLSEGLVIFADGACDPNPGPGGWGFAVYRDGREIHADCGGDPDTTNNIMEMTGVLMALQWFRDRGAVEPVRLLCDSRYVVNGCNTWRHGWKEKGWKRGPEKQLANAELWQELDAALAMVPVTLEWVKGHAGIEGNERADELAMIGRERIVENGAPSAIETQLTYEVA
ncbi:ribonuclease H family protein [Nitratireductor sp. PBL-C9]|uniref:ribonuclease H family protein n=1 Tax=Nitratireductor sp. PBL-C9 TaxID=3435013 RepID=UPI003D7D442C